ncbi:MAG: translational GTPase TypA [Bacilli bacterium]
MDKIINIGVVAHVDVGKSTLVDALLKQCGTFRENEFVGELVMDSDAIEKERGITIYSKNCSIKYKDYKINIVDTPGHADFSSEVERVMKTVDTVILLVDSAEGPMPQTRFVLEKALHYGLNPILFINKIDKKDARVDEVVNMTFDLFCDLGATDEQLDFPIVYGSARDGVAKLELDQESDSINPLLDVILEKVKPFEGKDSDPLQLQVSSLDYDDYIGRLAVGRINKGMIKLGQNVVLSRNSDGSTSNDKIARIYTYAGLRKVEVNEAHAGEMVIVSVDPNISIGDTICDKDHVDALPRVEIEKPKMSMNFLVNSSPFAGNEGKYLTNRHIKERLDKELQTNVGLQVESLNGADGFKVSGRGELHLSILLENMRREGYELSVSKPQVLMQEENGRKLEPFERVLITVPNEMSGTVINDINERKGLMQTLSNNLTHTKLEFLVPTRGLIGYRSTFITNTRGEGIMVRSFDSYMPYVGLIKGRKNGVLISMENGKAMAYSLWNLSDRGTMIINPGDEVYKGMIMGINNREDDLNVNPCKNKAMSNTRSSGADEALTIPTPKIFTLEEALEFIEDDELVELTPISIRIRKKALDEKDRKPKK